MLGDWIDWLHTQPLVQTIRPHGPALLKQTSSTSLARSCLATVHQSCPTHHWLDWIAMEETLKIYEHIYMHLPSKEYINRSSCLPYSQYQPIPERHTKWLARNVHYSLFTIHQKCSMVQKCSLFTSITMLVSLFTNMICWTFPDEVWWLSHVKPPFIVCFFPG